MNKKALCIATCAALAALSQPLYAAQNPDALARLEAKWLGVMTKIRGWNADALQQFRDGYKDYPAAVLEKALAAETFEAMQATLDAHAGKRAQEAMQKAMRVYSMGATRPEDADNPQIAEAKALVGKALGDDARDLVFIPITPCTVWDTRFATDPASAGIINNAVTKRFYSHLDGAGGSFAAWGGNPSCPETAQNFIGVRPFAVMMTVYINDASAQGWLTLYRDGDPDPSFATISVYYSPGPTRTQTVISKSSRGYGSGTYDIAAVSRFGNTNASASITGYFVKVNETGTVSSVGTGPGLTGGPITTSGTIDLAATNLLPTAACGATQIPRWNGSAWECSNDIDTNSGGTVTAVTAAAPLESTGGNTPQISFAAAASGSILVGTGGAPTFTQSPSISGNLELSNSTAVSGNITKAGNRFMHNFGSQNTYLGAQAGSFNLGGQMSTGVGANALNVNQGLSNTAVGVDALSANTSGGSNTAIGATAMRLNQSGVANVAIGSIALDGNNNGSQITAVGSQAAAGNLNGNFVTAVGYQALRNADADRNIALGWRAGYQVTTGAHNVLIANEGAAAESNTIRIGTASNQTRAFVEGIRGVTTDVADAIPVVIDSAGQLGTVSSSAAAKENIADMGAASSALMQLRPVTFDYRSHQAGSRLQYGLIAEEVDKVYPGLVAKRGDGSTETVMYHFLPPMLLNEYQKQQREIVELRAQVERLTKLLEK